MDIHLTLNLFIRRDESNIFQGFIVNLYPIRSNSPIIEEFVVSILPYSPQAERKDVIPIYHSIKAFVTQQKPSGVPILGLETGYVQPTNLGACLKKMFPKLLNYGALKEDMTQIFRSGVTTLTSRVRDHPYSTEIEGRREPVML